MCVVLCCVLCAVCMNVWCVLARVNAGICQKKIPKKKKRAHTLCADIWLDGHRRLCLCSMRFRRALTPLYLSHASRRHVEHHEELATDADAVVAAIVGDAAAGTAVRATKNLAQVRERERVILCCMLRSWAKK